MINFNAIKYERVSYESTESKIKELINKLNDNNNFEEYLNLCKEIIRFQNYIEEMYEYADICNMRDSEDSFYKEEITYWNEYKPKFDLLFIPFYKLIINSKYKEELFKYMPVNFFNTIEYRLKTNSLKVVELKQRENEFKTRYREIVRSKILFNDEEVSLSYVTSFFTNSNREVRKNAHDVLNDFYLSKEEELDDLFYELIMIRKKIAKELGFDNYPLYSLYELRRFGYDYNDIKIFRDNIIKYIVPICDELRKRQMNELGVEKLMYYDTIYYADMPKLLCLNEDLLKEFKKSLSSISISLSTFFKTMLDGGYFDLLPSNNKVNFAITNYLTTSCKPTITVNMKNNYTDVSTISHELGHAYQKYFASIKDTDYIVSSLLKYPTFDIAEMFSYAMELITMKHTSNLFTEEDYKKYMFLKVYNLTMTLPYICLVDEFQEVIYSKEDLSKSDIRNIWLSLSHKYKQDISNKGHLNLERGGYFYRQSHIFLNPFYYIDYALSYFGAFSIYDKCISNLDFFKSVGEVASYYPLDDLIYKFELPSPFSEESVERISKVLRRELFDDISDNK